jgi:hypothetical protein
MSVENLANNNAPSQITDPDFLERAKAAAGEGSGLILNGASGLAPAQSTGGPGSP